MFSTVPYYNHTDKIPSSKNNTNRNLQALTSHLHALFKLYKRKRNTKKNKKNMTSYITPVMYARILQ